MIAAGTERFVPDRGPADSACEPLWALGGASGAASPPFGRVFAASGPKSRRAPSGRPLPCGGGVSAVRPDAHSVSLPTSGIA